MKNNQIHVESEIGRLRKVIVHRPGKELLNVIPGTMEELLFDEIPFLEGAQAEHDNFVKIFKETGTEVFYLEDLAAESITSEEIKKTFVEKYLDEAGIIVPNERKLVSEILYSLDNKDMVLKMMEGTRKSELPQFDRKTLREIIMKDEAFVINPMPNLYFTRDPFSLVGNGVSLNSMWSNIRRRETIFGEIIFKHHPMFEGQNVNMWYDRDMESSIEGGDILVLSDKVVAVGISQRTSVNALELFAERILKGDSGYETVLALTIPSSHAFMHLDTVFTMVDKDLFTLHPEIDETLQVYSLKLQDEELVVEQESSIIEDVLKKFLETDKVNLIREGTGTMMDAIREQWSDGYNTLAIAPREAIVYERNIITNEELSKNGVKLHVLNSGELSRGRGGPRCMSMPMFREDL